MDAFLSGTVAQMKQYGVLVLRSTHNGDMETRARGPVSSTGKV